MEEDDVPPLEDMSETFSNSLKLREERTKAPVAVAKREILEVPNDVEKLQAKRIEKLLGKDDVDTMTKDKEEKKRSVKKTNAPNTYCGFKKGFFSTPTKESTNNKQKSKKGQVPTVTKKVDENKNVLPEVQKAINEQVPLLKSNDWVTEDLLTKIMSHPKLSKQFTDPRFADVVQKFQSNPEQVMRMCESDSEMKEFIQNFCGIMGDHFTKLGGKEDQKAYSRNNKQSRTPTDNKKKELRPDDEKKMKAILSDPEIVSILNTVEIQKMLKVLKEEPDKAPRLLRSADAALRQKIQKLVDVGLLQMAV